MHDFRIYTSPDILSGDDDANQEELRTSDAAHIPEAIRVFQIENMLFSPDNNSGRFGNINSETLVAMNDALSGRWHREQYFEGVHHVAPYNTRYFIRQGVVPIVPRFNQQGTDANGNAVAGWNWRNTFIPRLRVNGERRRMYRSGCAVAFVANIAFTHRERLIGSGINAAILPQITPGDIVVNDYCVSDVPRRSPVYFYTNGHIFWAAPLNTLVAQIDGSFALTDRDPRDNPSRLEPRRFNELMNDLTHQYYVGINVNTLGLPANNSGLDHWVGASAIVLRNATGTGIPSLFYKISPTSENDWINNTNSAARVARGWQHDGNNIYVPLTQVRNGFRIFRIPQNQ
jgi:hypothetical protein